MITVTDKVTDNMTVTVTDLLILDSSVILSVKLRSSCRNVFTF